MCILFKSLFGMLFYIWYQKERYLPRYTLFRKKRFEINFFVQKNASKFAIFIEKENPCVDIDQGIHKVKLKVARNEKRKKNTWVFFLYKYSKF